ncbi:MAG TPA: hypothetical protein VK907_09250 [Phnomibacter sp.]|nr:hypothetical protein [Phnomibacter sp.]
MRVTLICLIALATSLTATAQMRQTFSYPAQQRYQDTTEPQKGFDPSRLVFGGNLGASFGDLTFINISPQVGYQFSRVITAGAGINYINTGIKYRDFNGRELYKETFGYAGLNLFTRVFPVEFLFAMVQPEFNYSWGKLKFPDGRPNVKLDGTWVPSLLVGAGAMLGGQGGRGGMMLSLQYDLAQDPRSPYGSNAFIAMGFAF